MKEKNENIAEVKQVKRYLFLAVGLLIMAFGVAFSIKAGLGTSPISRQINKPLGEFGNRIFA